MRGSYYDVVVLGRRVGCLASAAILAKRGFRVCVLSQGQPSPTFRSGSMELPRRPFAMLPARSPVLQRVLRELAAGPLHRRHVVSCDPHLQVVSPRHRIDFWSDPRRRQQDLDRRFTDERQAVHHLDRDTRRMSATLDRLIDQDVVWPPGTFWERREFNRAGVGALLAQADTRGNILDHLPKQLATAVQAAHRIADGTDPDHGANPVRLLRPWSHWMDGTSALPEGEKTLEDLLVDRLETYGGTFARDEMATQVSPRRNQRDLILQLKSGEEMGAGHVIAGVDVHQLSRWLSPTWPIDELFERHGEPSPQYYRYSVAILVANQGIPPGLGRFILVVPDPAKPLRGENLLSLEHRPGTAEATLIIECLIPRQQLEGVTDPRIRRKRVLTAVKVLLPFLDEHVRWVDSPHDGLGADKPDGSVVEPEHPWTRGPKWMDAVFRYRSTDPLGVSGLPCRTGFKRLLLCNGQVVPGLGLEGDLLSALSCARIVTRSNRRLMWMRRGLWTKAEV